MYVLVGMPLIFVFRLFEMTADIIKLKVSIIYFILAFLVFILSRQSKLNLFVWRRVVDKDSLVGIINLSVILSFLFGAIFNLLFAYLTSVDVYVDSKTQLAFFIFVLCPFFPAFLIKYKLSDQSPVGDAD